MNSKYQDEDPARAAEISEVLDQMWVKFLPEIRERVRLLEDAGRASEAEALSEQQREDACSTAHKLAGTLGMFGLARGTELARKLEHLYAGKGGALAAAQPGAIAAEIHAVIENRK